MRLAAISRRAAVLTLCLALPICLANTALADMSIAWENKIYSVPSPSAAFGKAKPHELKDEPYLRIDITDSTATFGVAATLPEFKPIAIPGKPKIEIPEGCGEHPMRWLNTSRITARTRNMKPRQVAFGLPAGYAESVGKAAGLVEAMNARAEKNGFNCAKNAKIYARAQEQIAFALCDDGLNSRVSIFNKAEKLEWKFGAEYTISDNCP